MSKKIRVGILFGGKSAEHEISLQSAKNVIEAMDRGKYDLILIGIDKKGQWRLGDQSRFLLNPDDPKSIRLNQSERQIVLIPGREDEQLVSLTSDPFDITIDVAFPILHGPLGEDGAMQGLLKLAGIPFVGAGILGSAIGMDKDVAKRLIRDAGLPTARFRTFTRSQMSHIEFSAIRDEFGLPLFIKPVNMGSSVGVSKANNQEQFEAAIQKAFRYDAKILVEEHILGRELECSVLGNEEPIASLPGEVVAQHDFYSYEAKYIDEHGARLDIPAELSPSIVKRVQALAVKTFVTLNCEGMARVDLFLKESGELYVNEINTIPGFTKISMYPKLWEASGIGYSQLIDRLIQLAIDRHARDSQLASSYDM